MPDWNRKQHLLLLKRDLPNTSPLPFIICPSPNRAKDYSVQHQIIQFKIYIPHINPQEWAGEGFLVLIWREPCSHPPFPWCLSLRTPTPSRNPNKPRTREKETGKTYGLSLWTGRMVWSALRGLDRAFIRALSSSRLACSWRGLSGRSSPNTKALWAGQRKRDRERNTSAPVQSGGIKWSRPSSLIRLTDAECVWGLYLIMMH